MKTRFFLVLVRALQKSGVTGIRRLAGFLGATMWFFLRTRRTATVMRIAERLECDEEQARRIARASFTHTARSFLDILIADRLGMPDIPYHDENWRVLYKRMAEAERPVVVITGHFGPWELGGTFMGRIPGKRVFSVVRRYKDPVMHELIRQLRLEYGLETVDHRDAAGVILDALRGNNIACFLADHNTSRKEAIFLPFLGKIAAVNMGPALLAVRAKALIQPNFIRREDDGSVSVRFEEPLDTRELSGSVDERVRQAAEFYTAAIERQIRACPEQWFWMHNRWKTRPKGE